MPKTTEIKIRVEPEFRRRLDGARGLVSLSAWVTDVLSRELSRLEAEKPAKPGKRGG